MAHFDSWHGQKWRILTFSIKQKTFIYHKQMIIVIWKKSKFFIFDPVKRQNGPCLAETEKRRSKLFICCAICGNYQKALAQDREKVDKRKLWNNRNFRFLRIFRNFENFWSSKNYKIARKRFENFEILEYLGN